MDPHPNPAEAAEFADFFQQALAGLADEERQVVDLKLQELTNEEVAELRQGIETAGGWRRNRVG